MHNSSINMMNSYPDNESYQVHNEYFVPQYIVNNSNVQEEQDYEHLSMQLSMNQRITTLQPMNTMTELREYNQNNFHSFSSFQKTVVGQQNMEPSSFYQHSCAICQKRFISRTRLIAHELEHTGDRPYICPFGCGKSYVRSDHLCRHTQSAHSESLTLCCQVENCNAKFYNEVQLRKHQCIHSRKRSLESTGNDNAIETSNPSSEIYCQPIGINESNDASNKGNKSEADHQDKDSKHSASGPSESTSISANSRVVEDKDLMFHCEICGMNFFTYKKLCNHVFRLHEMLHQCPIPDCTRHYSRSDHLMRHMREKHYDKLKYRCDVTGCDLIYLTSKELRRHSLSHLNSDEKKNVKQLKTYHCNVCFEVFDRQQEMRLHRITSHQNKFFPCNAESCIFLPAFSSKLDLDLHVNTFHRMGDINMMQVISENSLYPCRFEGCTSSFTTIEALTIHVQTHVTSESAFACSKCENRFTSIGRLRRHEIIHEVRKQKFSCNYCTETFCIRKELNEHVKNHHQQVFTCDVEGCGMTFLKFWRLKKHKAQHSISHDAFGNSSVDPFVDRSLSIDDSDSNTMISMSSRVLICRCPSQDCNSYFLTEELLREHMQTSHHLNGNYVDEDDEDEDEDESSFANFSGNIIQIRSSDAIPLS